MNYRKKLAKLIDCSWSYSRHWPEDSEAAFPVIRENINHELDIALKRVRNLKEAEQVLDEYEDLYFGRTAGKAWEQEQ